MKRTRGILRVIMVAILLVGFSTPVMAGDGPASTATIEDVVHILRTWHLVPLDEQTQMQMMEEMIEIFVRELDDPYTSYLSAEQYERYVQRLEPEVRYGVWEW